MSEHEPIPARVRQRPAFAQLEIFLKVVETRSFVGAARLLGMSQPAVSQSIARLEDIFSGDLFVRRRGAPLSLTPIGEAILPSARSLLHTVDHQIVRAIATAQSQAGSLGVGFYPGIVTGPLRDGLDAFIAECPDVRLRLVEGLPGELLQQLSEHGIDIMFAGFMPALARSALVQEHLWQERLFAILPADHELASAETLTWDAVATQPIILRTSQGETSPYRAILARIGEQTIDCEQHAVSRGSLMEMVAMGMGLTIAFPSALVARAGLVARPIAGDRAVVAIDAVWHDADRNPIRHRLVRLIRAAVQRMSPST